MRGSALGMVGLKGIHERLLPRTYLSLGVDGPDSVAAALSTTRCVGVGPKEVDLERERTNAIFVAATSDDFFANHTTTDLVGRSSYDLVYIEGARLFERALRDFVNAEACSSSRSVVAIRGCAPKDAESASRVPNGSGWCGDVWKLVVALQKYRPDLRIQRTGTGPDSVSIISRLDAASVVLRERMPAILQEFLKLPFEASMLPEPVASLDLRVGFRELLGRISFHFWETVRTGSDTRRVPLTPVARPPRCNEEPCSLRRAEPQGIARPKSLRRTPRMLGVLLCYNDADVLPDAMEALLETNHDLIVWDHGSTDATASVLDRYGGSLVERHFLPRVFDFYELYPTVSRHLMAHFVSKYDWISWPDQDEVLEGPDRSLSYPDYVRQVLDEGFTHARFDNFNYWFTSDDDGTLTSPTRRVRHYCVFPDCAPRIRGWKADVTNERWFNHNPLPGAEYPIRFRLRHYPARDYEQALQRILFDRASLRRGSANVHYDALGKKLAQIVIDPHRLHYDDGIHDLHTEVLFDWLSIYREAPAR